MKITNKLNLPQPVYDVVVDVRDPKQDRYGVTTLINPIRQTILIRQHWDEIEQDVSDMTNLIFGIGIHDLLEKYDKTEYSEIKYQHDINGTTIVGKIDKLIPQDNTIVDYKTSSVYKIIKNDFTDWKNQGIKYAYLAKKTGIYIDKLKFIVFLKDWSAKQHRLARLSKKYYPDSQIYVWQYDISTNDLIECERDIVEKTTLLNRYKDSDEKDIPMCTDDERWHTPDKWAVMKKGRKRALKLCDSEDDATEYVNANDNCYIEYRPGEDRRCEDYCLASKFCKRRNVI